MHTRECPKNDNKKKSVKICVICGEMRKNSCKMNWEIIITVISTLGGFEGVRWWMNRKTNARMQETKADSDEFHLLREQIEFLQTQLRDKEVRFAEQTELVRRQNADIIKLMNEKAALDLELVLKRCERKKCAAREPQNGY